MAVKTYLEGGSQYGSVGQILLGRIDGLMEREEGEYIWEGWAENLSRILSGKLLMKKIVLRDKQSSGCWHRFKQSGREMWK